MPKAIQPKRFALGTHVLVGMGRRPGRVTFLDDRPSTMGEYVHKVETEHGEETTLGCDLELVPEAVTNAEKHPITGFRDIHFHGHNSRVNVNSVDNSTNQVYEKNHAFFQRMQEAAQSIPDGAKRDEIRVRLDELEKAQGKGGFLHAYERFIGVAADHMTLFSSFLPTLAHMIAGKF